MDTTLRDVLALNQPIVIDNVRVSVASALAHLSKPFWHTQGSGVIKAGFAGEEQPKTIFPS